MRNFEQAWAELQRTHAWIFEGTKADVLLGVDPESGKACVLVMIECWDAGFPRELEGRWNKPYADNFCILGETPLAAIENALAVCPKGGTNAT
jgi:hypothetical protein